MATIAKKHVNQLDRIKENVSAWHKYYRKNNERFNSVRKFVFETTVTEADRAVAIDTDKPEIEINILRPYVARQLGEFSKQTPNLKISARNDSVDPGQVELVEGIVRSIFVDSDSEYTEYEAYKDCLSGGYSVFKVYTEYEHDKTLDQVIRFDKIENPTLCGFDPLAKKRHKADGRYCYELIPKTKEEFEAEYPDINLDHVDFTRTAEQGINWFYRENDNKVVYIADYYEKKDTWVMLYQVGDPRNPQVMEKEEYDELIQNWNQIEQPPEIIKKVRRKRTKIMRYKFIGSELIETATEIDFSEFPLVFVPGEVVTLTETGERKEFTIPYVFGALDAQRVKNFSLSTIVNEIENMRQTDVIIPEASIPAKEEYQEAWLDPQKAKAALVYNHVDPNDPDKMQLPPPQVFPRGQINAANLQLFAMIDKSVQSAVGSYDAELGIQQKQLSGVAIVEGATQSNAAAMPYIVNFLIAMNQIAKIIVDLIPKYYTTMRTVPVTNMQGKQTYQMINQMPQQQGQPNNSMEYDKSALDVTVKAGANFEVQKNRALETMTQLASVLPSIAQLLNQNPQIVIDNLDIRGQDQLKLIAEKQVEEQKAQQQQGANQPNPQMLAIQLEQQKLQLQAHEQAAKFQLEKAKIQQKDRDDQVKLIQAQIEAAARLRQSDAEEIRAQAMLEIKQIEAQTKHLEKIV